MHEMASNGLRIEHLEKEMVDLLSRIAEIEAKASRLERRIIELEDNRDVGPLPADYSKGILF
jgi:predicted  nucleic acid-binding Zn-ribbon protein